MTLTLLSPMKGWVGPLEEIPDAVFAERMLGDGVAIDPTGATMHAPCDGEVVSVASTGHAVTLRADNGAEILIHIGLETVALKGEGFLAEVRGGQRVKAGDLLISFDMDLVGRRATSLLTPILVTNPDIFAISWRAQDVETEVGDPLMLLKPVALGEATSTGKGCEHRRTIKLGLAHGLHARPAGRVAAMLKPLAAEVALLAKGRTANARSAVGLMTLGVVHGDALELVSQGADAAAALDMIATFLADDGGEIAPPPSLLPPVPARGPLVNGVLRGVSAAPGYAIGRAVQHRRPEIQITEAGAGVAHECTALAQALNTVRKRTKSSAYGSACEDEIMAAHLALLDDPDLHAAAGAFIANGKSAAYAWGAALDDQANALRRLDDPRLRARASDLIDLKRQVLGALGGETPVAAELPDDAILLADDLMPSELMAVGGQIIGLCSAAGGPTSHVAIIAAAMNIPAVAAAGPAVLEIADGTPLIIDADAGTLRIDPTLDEIGSARAIAGRRAVFRAAAVVAADRPCHMADGKRIEVFANLANVAETASAVASGAEGCGLLRSEFLFMDRTAPPDEEEQRAAYQAIADALEGRPFIIRTLDIGGDKPVAYLALPREDNPALGLRGVRSSLWRPALLRTQLRAILRVAPSGACKIMVPMVSSSHELSAVRAVLEAEKQALGLDAPVELGVMIETPAAAVMAAALAEAADFFSIGTNDLTQYALAMDRTNPLLGAEVDALHPAVLRLIGLACEGARAKDRPIGVCGGLASEPLAAAVLIGLGVAELSVPPSMIPALKATIRSLRMDHCRILAAEALAQTSTGAVRALLQERVSTAPLEAVP